jgi:hypothetical protein
MHPPRGSSGEPRRVIGGSIPMSNCTGKLRSEILPCLVILGATVVLLAPWLTNQEVAIISPTELGTDMIAMQWPNATYITDAWKTWGEIPLWRRTTMGGGPIIGNPSMLLAYPVYWIIFLYPIGWSLTLYLALHLVWAALGAYGFARRVLKLSPGGALISALTFAFSAKILAHMGGGHIGMLAALAWLPWL